MLVPPIVRIRPGRPSDADAIAHVYIEAWRSAYAGLVPNAVLVRMSVGMQAREWAQQLSRRKLADSVLVADLSGHGIIGFGSCGRPATRYCPMPARFTRFTCRRSTMIAAWGARYS